MEKEEENQPDDCTHARRRVLFFQGEESGEMNPYSHAGKKSDQGEKIEEEGSRKKAFRRNGNPYGLADGCSEGIFRQDSDSIVSFGEIAEPRRGAPFTGPTPLRTNRSLCPLQFNHNAYFFYHRMIKGGVAYLPPDPWFLLYLRSW